MYHIKKRVSVISWLFILLIFLQGCVVYQKKPVTLERAFQEGLKTKVVTDSGNTFKFKRIGFEDGKFYGVMISNGEITKVSLQENELSKIILKNEFIRRFAMALCHKKNEWKNNSATRPSIYIRCS